MPFKNPLSEKQKRRVTILLRGPLDRKQLRAAKKKIQDAIKAYGNRVRLRK